MMWFFRHFWIFISYHIFLLNQVEGAIAIPPSNSASLPLFCPSVCPSVNRSVNHIFRFLHICWQVTGKEWHRVRNADVSRWLTLGQHWCRWVLLSFHVFVRPSNHPLAWVCVLHTKRLEEMAYNLACWCIFFCFFFSKVRVGAKEGGSHYWEMAVAITCGYGGYLLPLLAAHSSFFLIFMQFKIFVVSHLAQSMVHWVTDLWGPISLTSFFIAIHQI